MQPHRRDDWHDSLALAGQGKVKAIVAPERMENINDIFQRMHKGQIDGRIVMNMALEQSLRFADRRETTF